MRAAGIHARKGKYFVQPASTTVNGIQILTEPCMVLEESVEDTELGAVVLAALDCSREGVLDPAPDEFPSLLKPLLRAARVGSWRAFVVGTAYVDIEDDGIRLIVTSYVNRGSRRGFEPDEGSAILADRASPADVGARIREAFARTSR